MAYTADELSRRLGGTVEGDPQVRVDRLAGLEDAEAGCISFLANPRYASAVAATRASVVVVADDWRGETPCTLIRVKNPDLAFAQLAPILGPPPPEFPAGIHPSAVLAEGVEVDPEAFVGAHCVLEAGVRIGARSVLIAGVYIGHESSVGEDCRLFPGVTVRERVRIGDRVAVHSGSVIGSDGFGYVPTAEGWSKIAQIGTVEIHDDVEIGANVTIDRGRFGPTVLGRGVKIDNLVQIAHNVRVGAHSAMAALVGVSGSTTIGEWVRFGGQAGVSGHVHIGDGVVVAGQAGVTKDVEAGTMVSGYPAIPHSKAQRVQAGVMRLPLLRRRVADLEARIAAIEARTASDGET